MIAFSLEISQPKDPFAFPHPMMSFPWHWKLMNGWSCSSFSVSDVLCGSFPYNLCRCFHKRANEDILPVYLNIWYMSSLCKSGFWAQLEVQQFSASFNKCLFLSIMFSSILVHHSVWRACCPGEHAGPIWGFSWINTTFI